MGDPDPPPDTGRESVGIALSGGGIRAAAFSMGVLEVLHRDLGLLRGPRAAEWMSAVSGGSYTAGMVALLNAGDRATYVDGSPAQAAFPSNGSPLPHAAVAHVGAHSRYLVDDGVGRLIWRLGVPLVSGLVVVLVFVAWIGAVIVGDVAAVSTWGATAVGLAQWWEQLAWPIRWIVGLGGVLAFGMLVATSLRRASEARVDGGPRRRAWPWVVLYFVGVLGFVVFMPVLLTCIQEDLPWLASPAAMAPLLPGLLIGLACVVGLAVVLTVLGGRVRILGRIGGMLTSALVRLIPLALVLLLITWIGVWMFDALAGLLAETPSEATAGGSIVLVAVAVGGVLVIPLPGLISPHRAYRELLARCFALRWTPAGSVERMPDADRVALSSMGPAEGGEKVPELIISAAANISDVGVTSAGANVLPLEITSSSISIPTVPDATIPIEHLEQMRAPKRGYGIVRPRPMIGLSSAVAITGAAVSPSMGRRTKPGLRPLLAAFNIRLGAWLPNPLYPRARESAQNRRERDFSVGIDQLVWEMMGHHSSKAMVVYASDGGHYENLAIMPLLRRRCRVIWAIDASPDRRGACDDLGDTVRLAFEELTCRIDLAFEPFADRDERGNAVEVCGTGDITYDDGSTGVLHVIRLGVTAQHGSALRQYSERDKSFPYHSTIYQVFTGERVTSYRLLGLRSAEIALQRLARRQQVPDPAE